MADIATPFAALSLIGAPAILTNASSLLAMSTSNRLARAVDRARELARELEHDPQRPEPEDPRRLQELLVNETRAELLLRVLRSFYMALGGFAAATLISLLGVVLSTAGPAIAVRVCEWVGLAAGATAVGALINGAALLLQETRLAVGLVHERVKAVRARLGR